MVRFALGYCKADGGCWVGRRGSGKGMERREEVGFWSGMWLVIGVGCSCEDGWRKCLEYEREKGGGS